MEYFLHIGIVLLVYTIIVVSTNLLVGYSNLISLGQAAFFGIGAYIMALCTMELGLSAIPSLLIIMLVNMLVALLLAISSIKLKGDFFILATLAFQFIVYSLLYNWKSLTGGSLGITGIPSPRFLFIYQPDSNWAIFIMALILAVIVLLTFRRLFRSPYGIALKALRQDEVALQSMGRNTRLLKIYSFVISAVFIGWGSFIYASYLGYIHPGNFNLEQSILILIAVLIGGAGTVKGSVIGAAFIVIVPELIRYLGLPGSVSASLQQVIYGLILILVVYLRPAGLAGNIKIK